MSNILPEVMRYFRSCYQADMRAVHLLDFLGKKVAFPRLFTDEAFISGQLETYPLPTDYGEQLAKHLHLYAKEQQLYCFAFFLTGKTKILGKFRPVCAPLYLIPATLLYENDIYQISLDFSQVLLNPAFTEVQEITHIGEYTNAFMSKQLRAASFQHLLSYRDNSILDLVFGKIQQQEQVFLLNEHYRSLPDIIRFSNEQFYRSALHIMTSTPCRNKRSGVHFNHVVDGERNEKGQNTKEATAIMQAVVTMMEKESELPSGLCQSIGIISPFRAQVEHFKRLIKAVLTNEQIRRHRLLVGTAHDFQGEERDVILNSWVVDAETPKGVFTYLNKEDVFNVSITRARSLQQNFISAHSEQLPGGSLLRSYVNANITDHEQSEEEPITDDFLEEVYEFLQSLGVDEILVDYSIAGVNIDLVVVHRGETYCIDLIGYPGYYGHALSLDQWKTLSRVGVSATAISYSYWHYEREVCAAVLAGFIGAYTEEKVNQ